MDLVVKARGALEGSVKGFLSFELEARLVTSVLDGLNLNADALEEAGVSETGLEAGALEVEGVPEIGLGLLLLHLRQWRRPM